jgi:hypothetical protein
LTWYKPKDIIKNIKFIPKEKKIRFDIYPEWPRHRNTKLMIQGGCDFPCVKIDDSYFIVDTNTVIKVKRYLEHLAERSKEKMN